MKIQHKTEKGTVLFVLQPEEASDLTYPKVGMIDLYFQTKVQSKHEEDNYISIGLPNIGFQLIGLTSEVTEEMAKMMVDNPVIDEDFRLLSRQENAYMDYVKDCWHTGMCDALDSFKSLMQNLQVYEVNPYGETNILPEAEYYLKVKARCGKWIVLFKPNEK